MSRESLEVLTQAGIPLAQAHAIVKAIEIGTGRQRAPAVAASTLNVAASREAGSAVEFMAVRDDPGTAIQEVAREQARYIYGMFALQTVILLILMHAFMTIFAER